MTTFGSMDAGTVLYFASSKTARDVISSKTLRAYRWRTSSNDFRESAPLHIEQGAPTKELLRLPLVEGNALAFNHFRDEHLFMRSFSREEHLSPWGHSRRGLSSASNAMMWNHYGKDGVALRFKKEALLDSVSHVDGVLHYSTGEVTYHEAAAIENSFPRVSFSSTPVEFSISDFITYFLNHSQAKFFTKSHEWSFEREFRVVFVADCTDEFIEIPLEDSLKSVILGPRFLINENEATLRRLFSMIPKGVEIESLFLGFSNPQVLTLDEVLQERARRLPDSRACRTSLKKLDEKHLNFDIFGAPIKLEIPSRSRFLESLIDGMLTELRAEASTMRLSYSTPHPRALDCLGICIHGDDASAHFMVHYLFDDAAKALEIGYEVKITENYRNVSTRFFEEGLPMAGFAIVSDNQPDDMITDFVDSLKDVFTEKLKKFQIAFGSSFAARNIGSLDRLRWFSQGGAENITHQRSDVLTQNPSER